jgi:hypothetical protein
MKRTAELEAKLLELEIFEEALIMRAHGDGLVDHAGLWRRRGTGRAGRLRGVRGQSVR